MKPACFGKDYRSESRYCNNLFQFGHGGCLHTEACKKECRRQQIWKFYKEGMAVGEITKRIYGQWKARLEANVWSTIHSFERKQPPIVGLEE